MRWSYLLRGLYFALLAGLGSSQPSSNWPDAQQGILTTPLSEAERTSTTRPFPAGGLTRGGSCLNLDSTEGVTEYLERVLSGHEEAREQARRAATSSVAQVRWLIVRRAMPEVADYFDDELDRAETVVFRSLDSCDKALATKASDRSTASWRAEAARDVWYNAVNRSQNPVRAHLQAEHAKTTNNFPKARAHSELADLRYLISEGLNMLNRDANDLFANTASAQNWVASILGRRFGDLPGRLQGPTGIWLEMNKTKREIESDLTRGIQALRDGEAGSAALVRLYKMGVPVAYMQVLAQDPRLPQADSEWLGSIAQELAYARQIQRGAFIREALQAVSYKPQITAHRQAQFEIDAAIAEITEEILFFESAYRALHDSKKRLGALLPQ